MKIGRLPIRYAGRGALFYAPLYFFRVARPPRMWRWALFSSITALTCRYSGRSYSGSLRQVLVDGGLADAELFGGGADRGPVFYEVMGQLHGPLLQIVANRAPLLYTFAAGLCLCGGRGGYAVWMHKKGRSAPPFLSAVPGGNPPVRRSWRQPGAPPPPALL